MANTFLDSGKIGQGTAQPAFHHIGHLTAHCLGLQDLFGLVLGADKQNRVAARGNFFNGIIGLLQILQGFLQINNMDSVPLHKNIGLHFRIPAPGEMSEVNTGF